MEKELTENFHRLRLVSKTKFSGRNKIKAINPQAVSFLRYEERVIAWILEELNSFDQENYRLYARYFIKRVTQTEEYVPRTREGKGPKCH